MIRNIRSDAMWRVAVSIAFLYISASANSVVTAQVFWLPNSDGNWEESANWSGGTVPGPSDNVMVDVGGATVRSIAINSSISSINTLTSEERIVISGGKLETDAGGTLDGGLTFDNTPGDLIANGGVFSASGAVNLDRSLIMALGGATVQLDSATSYAAGATSFFQPQRGLVADGSSQIDLSAVITLAGGTSFVTMAMEATNGSTIDLSSLLDITEGTIQIAAIGPSSLVDLSSLQNFSSGSSSELIADSGGEIRLNTDAAANLNFQNVNITLEGAGTINTSRITEYAGGSLVSNGVDRIFNISSTTSSSFAANDAILDLQSVTGSFDNETFFERKIVRAEGSGSAVLLNNVTSIQSDFADIHVEALTGGIVNFQSVQTIDDLQNGTVKIEADGPGSSVVLTSLSDLRGAPGRLEPVVVAGDGGLVMLNNSSKTTLTNVSVIVETGGQIQADAMDLVADGSFSTTQGLGLIVADVKNVSGAIAPGISTLQTTGALGIVGNFEQQLNGTIRLQLLEESVGMFDQLLIFGDAVLGGSLDVTIGNSFDLLGGMEFPVLEVDGVRTGEFLNLAQNDVVLIDNGFELRIDYFGGDGNDVVLFTIDQIVPQGQKLLDGVVVAGQLGDVAGSDDVYLELVPSPTTNPLKQKVEMILLSESPTGSPVDFSFVLEAAMTGGPSGDVIQTIELWNEQAGTWDLMDIRAASSSDLPVQVDADGDLTRYVHPLTDEVIAKVTWQSPEFSGPAFSWSVDIDQAIWLIR